MDGFFFILYFFGGPALLALASLMAGCKGLERIAACFKGDLRLGNILACICLPAVSGGLAFWAWLWLQTSLTLIGQLC